MKERPMSLKNRSKNLQLFRKMPDLFCSTLLGAHPCFFGSFNRMHRTKDSGAVRLSVVFSVTGTFEYL